VSNVLVDRMRHTIDVHYADALTLRMLSAELGRQPAYLGRLFRGQMSASVRDYLTGVRLTHAAELLRDGVKVEAVALNVGYRSKKNFYQQFRKHYGTTPLAYRDGPSRTRSTCSVTRRRCSVMQQVSTGADAPLPGPSGESLPRSGNGPGAESLSAIIRTSTRAWQRAMRAQGVLLKRFNQLRVALLITDDEGRYVAANGAAITMTGYSPHQLCGLSPDELFVTAPMRDTHCAWQLVLSSHSRRDQSPNATMRTKSGDSIAVYLVTLRNFLWGRREMGAILDRPSTAVG
jgi:PAS domain S-box-containing protein